MNADVIEMQFKSIQSLAEQWRIQLAALHGGSSGTSLSSAEEPRSVLPYAAHSEPLSHFNKNELSMASSHNEASGDLEPDSPQKVSLLYSYGKVFELAILLYEPIATIYRLCVGNDYFCHRMR